MLPNELMVKCNSRDYMTTDAITAVYFKTVHYKSAVASSNKFLVQDVTSIVEFIRAGENIINVLIRV